jgi:hypothetical protein
MKIGELKPEEPASCPDSKKSEKQEKCKQRREWVLKSIREEKETKIEEKRQN